MKNFLKVFLTFVAVFFLFSIPSEVHASSNIEVSLNNQRIYFTQAQPVNFNGRIMVPTREIAEYLGFKVDYNEATSTMTCTNGALTVTHKMLTNIITVNGVSKTFDTPSINRNDKMLMPVRMIAETLGAEFTYDPGETVVKVGIILNTSTTATINSLSFSNASVEYGGSIVITCIASNQTSRIRLTEANGNLIGDITNYTTLQDGSRIFNYTWSPKTTSQTTIIALITATPGNTTAFNDADKKTATVPLLGPPEAKITDIKTKSGNILLNETITVTVTTNNYAEKVRITNDFNSTVNESQNYTISGDKRIFSVNVRIEKIGERVLTVETANTFGYDSAQTKTHKVDVLSNATVDKLAIIDVTVSPDRVKPGSNATVTVVTSTYATKVYIEDADYASVKSLSKPTSTDTYNGTKTWEFTIRMNKTGSFNYYAIATQNSREVDKRFTIRCSSDGSSSSSSSDLTIKDIYSDPETVKVGGYADITVITTTDIDYVELFDNEWYDIDYSSKYYSNNNSKNERVWIFEDVRITKSGSNRFYVRAYDEDDYYTQSSVTVTGGSSSSSSSSGYATIYSIELDEEDYFYNDRVYVDVITSTDIVEVEIFDYNNKSVAYKRNYSSSSNNRRTWTLNFISDYKRSGKLTFTVVAYDNYNDTDEEDFSIWVDY